MKRATATCPSDLILVVPPGTRVRVAYSEHLPHGKMLAMDASTIDRPVVNLAMSARWGGLELTEATRFSAGG
jgi:hypothetical protein